MLAIQHNPGAGAPRVTDSQIVQQLVNTMMGGAMLILPLLFLQGGLVLSPLILALSGAICFQTCKLYVVHMKPNEDDMADMILRILGRAWYNAFSVLSCLYLFLACVLDYVIMVDMAYQMAQFFAPPGALAPRDQVTATRFGVFWLSLIVAVPSGALLFMRDSRRLTEAGVYCVYAFVALIFGMFIENVASGRVLGAVHSVHLASYDIGNLAGTSSLAFALHTAFASILRQQPDTHARAQNLSRAYLVGFCIYCAIGVFGAFGVLGRTPAYAAPQSVTDFFDPHSSVCLLVNAIFMFNLLSVLPCFYTIFKTRAVRFFLVAGRGEQQYFTDDVHGDDDSTTKYDKARATLTIEGAHDTMTKRGHASPHHADFMGSLQSQHGALTRRADIAFNVVFVVVAVAVRNVPAIKTGNLMALNGAISCFFIVYLIPIALHMKCLYGDQKTFFRRIKARIQGVRAGSEQQDESLRSNSNSNDAGRVDLIVNSHGSRTVRDSGAKSAADDNLQRLIQSHTQALDGDEDRDAKVIDSAFISKRVRVDAEERREETISYQHVCNDHRELENHSIYFRVLLYGSMFALGVCVFAYGVYSVFAHAVGDDTSLAGVKSSNGGA